MPADTAAAANPANSGQAPDEATKKITELVHAGRYAEAQQLTAGLLVGYPNDQRLIKAKALIERLSAPAGQANPTPGSNQPALAVGSANPGSLSGMDKVDYSGLIELARQAQQAIDLLEQKKLLQQFMEQSALFLQRHPDQTVLWQLRAASAISLNAPWEGYEAGQKLIAAGAVDSSDPNLQHLLGQLKNQGWLEKQEVVKQVERTNNYIWVLGTWKGHYSKTDKRGHEVSSGDFSTQLSNDDSLIEAYSTSNNGTRDTKPSFRGTILDSGEISWERRWASGWKPISFEVSQDKRTIRVVFTENWKVGQNAFGGDIMKDLTYTGTFTRK